MKLNNFTLPDETIRKMKEKIKNTEKTKIEHGFPLCIDEDKNVHAGKQCEGTRCSIKIKDIEECKKGHTKIGSYHTHPHPPADMSEGDTYHACESDIFCIGANYHTNEGKTPIINCYTKKIGTDKEKCKEHSKSILVVLDAINRMSEKKEFGEQHMQYLIMMSISKDKLIKEYFNKVEINK